MLSTCYDLHRLLQNRANEHIQGEYMRAGEGTVVRIWIRLGFVRPYLFGPRNKEMETLHGYRLFFASEL